MLGLLLRICSIYSEHSIVKTNYKHCECGLIIYSDPLSIHSYKVSYLQEFFRKIDLLHKSLLDTYEKDTNIDRLSFITRGIIYEYCQGDLSVLKNDKDKITTTNIRKFYIYFKQSEIYDAFIKRHSILEPNINFLAGITQTMEEVLSLENDNLLLDILLNELIGLLDTTIEELRIYSSEKTGLEKLLFQNLTANLMIFKASFNAFFLKFEIICEDLLEYCDEKSTYIDIFINALEKICFEFKAKEFHVKFDDFIKDLSYLTIQDTHLSQNIRCIIKKYFALNSAVVYYLKIVSYSCDDKDKNEILDFAPNIYQLSLAYIYCFSVKNFYP